MRRISEKLWPFAVGLIFTGLVAVYAWNGAQSTFLVDDWGQIDEGQVGLVDQIKNWTVLWAIRPVSWFVLPIVIQLFGSAYWAYFILEVFLLLGFSYFFIWKSFAPLSVGARVIGVFLVFTPAMASTLVFSPVNQFTAAFSLFLFALGHYVQLRNPERKFLTWPTLAAFFLFLASFATYEIGVPLIIWTVVIVLTRENISITGLTKPLLGSLPGIIAIVLVVAWQKLVAPGLGAVYSRANGLSTQEFVPFLKVLAAQTPRELLHYFMVLPVASIALTCIFFIVLSGRTRKEPRPTSVYALLLFGATSGLLFTGLLFVVSGQPADLFGYQNRGLSATWIYIALVLAVLTSILPKGFLILVAAICAGNFMWFVSDVSENVQASQVRLDVATTIVQAEKNRIEALNGGAKSSTVLTVEVPCILPESRSQVEVFCEEWDLKGAVNVLGKQHYPNIYAGDADRLAWWKRLLGPNFQYIDYRFDSDGNLLSNSK